MSKRNDNERFRKTSQLSYLLTADDLSPIDGVLLDEAVGQGWRSPGYDHGSFTARHRLDVGRRTWNWNEISQF